jgi:hypothetical protein
VATTTLSSATALRRYDSEPVNSILDKELRQLAKVDEKRVPRRENNASASSEVDLDNGATNAVILDDPERARLSE